MLRVKDSCQECLTTQFVLWGEVEAWLSNTKPETKIQLAQFSTLALLTSNISPTSFRPSSTEMARTKCKWELSCAWWLLSRFPKRYNKYRTYHALCPTFPWILWHAIWPRLSNWIEVGLEYLHNTAQYISAISLENTCQDPLPMLPVGLFLLAS